MSNKLAAIRKSLAKKEIYTEMNEPTNWISTGNAAMNYRISGNINLGIPNKRSCLLWGESGCVDADTEFLTPTGWKRIADYREGDMVAQFNKDTSDMSFVEPTEYIKKPCDEFYHFTTKYGVDQMLTPEHRVLYRSPKGKLQVAPAEEVVKAHNSETVNGFRGKFLTTFNPPTQIGMDISDEDLRLQVAVMADGSFNDKRTTWDNFVCVSVKKQRKKDRLMSLLEASGREYSRTDREDGFSRFEFGAPFKTKTYDSEFFQCNEHQLTVIAEECLLWDGAGSERAEFFSTKKQNADFIQYCFSATGRRARIYRDEREGRTTCYTVKATSVNEVSMAGSTRTPIERIQCGDGFKYCFAVPETFLVLRRNDCIFITGNTGKTFLTSNLVLAAQQQGYLVIYLDSEDSISEDYMTKIGIDLSPDKFMPVLVDTLEDVQSALSDIFSTMDADDKFILVIDSLAGLLTEKEEDEFSKGIAKGDMGQFSKKLKLLTKNINKKISEFDAFCVMVTHAYQNQDVLNGEGKWICTGGKGFQFFPSVSVKLEKAKLKEGTEVLNGVRIKGEVTKTRFAAPFQKFELKVPYDTGLNFTDGLLGILEEDGILKKNGGWYSYEFNGELIKFQASKLVDHYESIMSLYMDDIPEEKPEEDNES